MGTITLSIPQSGQPNATEDPKVASDLGTIQTVINGNLDTNNLSPSAGIALIQLAATAAGLATRAVAGNVTLNNRDLAIVAPSAPATVTLPAPTANNLVGIVSSSGFAITVTTPAGSIAGVGLFAASTTLGTFGSSMLLQADGTNWWMVAGQRDTGWTAMTLAAGLNPAAGFEVPSYRTLGDRVLFKGNLVNNTGSTFTSGSNITTIGVSARPPAIVAMPAVPNSTVTVRTDGTVRGGVSDGSGIANGGGISFDGLQFSLS